MHAARAAAVRVAAEVIATHLRHNLKQYGGRYSEHVEAKDVLDALKALGVTGKNALVIDADASGLHGHINRLKALLTPTMKPTPQPRPTTPGFSVMSRE